MWNYHINYSHILLYRSIREKMAFFTRKGLIVPEFPSDNILTEEPEEFNLPSTPSSLATLDDLTQQHMPKGGSSSDSSTTAIDDHQKPEVTSASAHSSIDNVIPSTSTSTSDVRQTVQQERYDYVVDRTYGVEV